MNLLGKIFTICILVASILLMVVAVAVYSTHTNWQTEYTAIKQRLDLATQDNLELESKYSNQISLLKAEQEAMLQDVRKLESARLELITQNAGIQKEVDQLRQERRASEELVKSTEENNNALTAEVVDLRNLIRQHLQARDEAFQTTLKATTDLHVTAGELQSIQERNAQLVADLASATSTILEEGLDPKAKVVPRVRGIVTSTRRADGSQLIEISVGSDDGVKQGQTIEIFRGERYLGRAKILSADPDRAVGQVIREFQKGQIQEGDDVATKLRIG